MFYESKPTLSSPRTSAENTVIQPQEYVRGLLRKLERPGTGLLSPCTVKAAAGLAIVSGLGGHEFVRRALAMSDASRDDELGLAYRQALDRDD